MKPARPLRRLFLGLILAAAVGWVTLAVAAVRYATRQVTLSSFTTDLFNRSDAQQTNIRLAASKLDGVTLRPGATFSFNDTVGRRCVEDGYAPAPALEAGGVVASPGGGICQLSSTLYNAALLAGLRIVERSPHLARVRSVGPGRDATVLYGRYDLRFANPYPFAVGLHTRIVGDRLICELTAAHPLPAPVSLRVDSSPTVSGLRCQLWRRIGTVETRISDDVYPR